MMTTNLWISKEGAAVEVELIAEERELMKHREGLTPHVSMAVSKGHSAGELGRMVTRLRCAQNHKMGATKTRTLYRPSDKEMDGRYACLIKIYRVYSKVFGLHIHSPRTQSNFQSCKL